MQKNDRNNINNDFLKTINTLVKTIFEELKNKKYVEFFIFEDEEKGFIKFELTEEMLYKFSTYFRVTQPDRLVTWIDKTDDGKESFMLQFYNNIEGINKSTILTFLCPEKYTQKSIVDLLYSITMSFLSQFGLGKEKEFAKSLSDKFRQVVHFPKSVINEVAEEKIENVENLIGKIKENMEKNS